MDTIENLIIAIVKPLISQPDALTIKIEDTPEFLEYHLDLDPSDVGRVIGRKGRTISAIRTIVYSVPTEDKKLELLLMKNKIEPLGLYFWKSILKMTCVCFTLENLGFLMLFRYNLNLAANRLQPNDNECHLSIQINLENYFHEFVG